ncbi:hypothetical protein Patl1_30173 [Pistacia atlantica]|uniref:Uncharacterized protein n=1 Tax=Pistacia atlantica TaxID=434234 RepID=A0ACC1AD31_9ROSI|nr:hypothetical protein Patl1_30173 [Pistacia atlantica]
MDIRLGGQYSKKAAQAVAAVALQCLQDDPKNRPYMVKVLAALEQLHTSKDMQSKPPHPKAKHTNHSHKTSSSIN